MNEHNKESLINLSKNNTNTIQKKITIANLKLQLEKKEYIFNLSKAFLFSTLSLAIERLLFFPTIFPFSICFSNNIKEHNYRNEIKINIKSHSASLCLYTQFMLHSPYSFSNLFVLTRSSFILLYPYKSTHILLLTDTLATVLPLNGILMQKVGCF